MKKNLPLALNTLDKLINGNCVYVDKTDIAWQLIRQPGAFFLSRPRRFGKSLFVDTLKEIFEGNKNLFKGLFIHDKWNWEQKYPVIKIDFSDGTLQNRKNLDRRIYEILNDNALYLKISLRQDRDIPGTFGELIRKAETKYGARTVVLIDEYDKPILDNIDAPETAIQMREGLKNLYSVLKGQDAHLQFVFMTGVSKFSKVSLFSGINQMTDITLNEDFATICGYTHANLQHHFGEHLKEVDWDKLKMWYNGYQWLGADTVYNPYDILLFIHNRFSYRNYWFETGNPSFLIKLFQKNCYFLPRLQGVEVTESILDSFDIEKIDPVTLLFQSGYLTIEKTFTRRDRMMFRLKAPNQEVQIALGDVFVDAYTGRNPSEKIPVQDALCTCLENGDIAGMIQVIQRLFAAIPWRNFTKNELADSEGFYASVLYAFFSSLNAEIIPEDITNHGQADMTVKLGMHVYVIEIKVVKTEHSHEKDKNMALEQIQDKNYAEKYRGRTGIKVHEVGLVFSRKLRNILSWKFQ